MCTIKKLCTCESVSEGEDYWRLEYHYGHFPSSGVVATRPEHSGEASQALIQGMSVMGPLPIPLFKELHRGMAEKSQIEKVIDAEEKWLNESAPFDFDYTPFQGDRLTFVIGGYEIAYSFSNEKWFHCPHWKYSMDHRYDIDNDATDAETRKRAKEYITAGGPRLEFEGQTIITNDGTPRYAEDPAYVPPPPKLPHPPSPTCAGAPALGISPPPKLPHPPSPTRSRWEMAWDLAGVCFVCFPFVLVVYIVYLIASWIF